MQSKKKYVIDATLLKRDSKTGVFLQNLPNV